MKYVYVVGIVAIAAFVLYRNFSLYTSKRSKYIQYLQTQINSLQDRVKNFAGGNKKDPVVEGYEEVQTDNYVTVNNDGKTEADYQLYGQLDAHSADDQLLDPRVYLQMQQEGVAEE